MSAITLHIPDDLAERLRAFVPEEDISELIEKLNKVITKRFLKFLEEEAKNRVEAYDEFHKEFGHFLKEGAALDDFLKGGWPSAAAKWTQNLSSER